jgi:hypothetical protein
MRDQTHLIDVHVPAKSERLKLSDEERFQLLERLGEVPLDADTSDYQLAEKTRWWGKRLDPKTFWANRIVWYDNDAELSARRRGRGWPPMPYEDPAVADRSDDDKKPEGVSLASPYSPHYVYSEREQAFWSRFITTHPRPPDDIETWLTTESKHLISHLQHPNPSPIYATIGVQLPPTAENYLQQYRIKPAQQMGYPTEALTEESLQWAYVMAKRAEFEKVAESGIDSNSLWMSNFFARTHVDRKFIVEPLSDENLKAANAWKVAYLRRLRAEKTDESYINAYLDAWNLSPQEVFGTSPR